MLRQFSLGPLNVSIEQTTDIAQTFQNELPNFGHMSGNGIRLGGQQPPSDFVEFLLPAVDGLHLRAVLLPVIVDYAIQEFERQLTTSLAGLSGQIFRMRQRREQIQQELHRLAETAAECGHSAA